MKTEFTKGEWIKTKHTNGYILITNDQNIIVCEIDLKPNDYSYPTPESSEANAKLIAAAPELLQNCIWCINNFKNILPVATKEESEGIYHSLIENLEQAIKKATQ